MYKLKAVLTRLVPNLIGNFLELIVVVNVDVSVANNDDDIG